MVTLVMLFLYDSSAIFSLHKITQKSCLRHGSPQTLSAQRTPFPFPFPFLEDARRTGDWQRRRLGPPGGTHMPASFPQKDWPLMFLVIGSSGGNSGNSHWLAWPTRPGAVGTPFPDSGIAFTVFRRRVCGVGGRQTRLSVTGMRHQEGLRSHGV